MLLVLAALAGDLDLAPKSGVDPDVARVLDEARAELQAGQPDLASVLIRRLYASDDRFTAAQRDRVASEAAVMLHDAAVVHQRDGDLERAVVALDAAWAITGHPNDEAFAAVLYDYAQRIDGPHPEQALYVVRRALTADPRFPAARRLERRLSENSMVRPAQVSVVLGGFALAGAGIGVVAADLLTSDIEAGGTREQLDRALGFRRMAITGTIASLSVAATGAVGGTILVVVGRRRYEPLSPPILPALPEYGGGDEDDR